MSSKRDPAHVQQKRFPAKPGLVSASNSNGLSRHFAEASAKVGAIRQPFETSRLETPKSDSPGLLLLDTLFRPLYLNDEAVSIVSYPQAPRANGHGADFLQRIDSLLFRRNGSPDPKFSGEFASGRRLYQVRVFALKSNLQNRAGPTLAVLLQRNREHPDLLRTAQRFHLTQRETAALELLMQGYTTKQIACRMGISPNTAKAFLRSVMFKSGATHRVGILAKILQL
jgi:DNA-binding CsgD family transcriptional regulator